MASDSKKVPHFDGLVVGAGNYLCVVKLEARDPVFVTLKGEHSPAGVEVPHLKRLVVRRANHEPRVELEVPHHPFVALRAYPVQGGHGLTGVDVPKFEGGVKGARDNLLLVKLEGGDRARVALDGPEALPAPKVPHLDGGVCRPADNLGLVKLDTEDGVSVPM